MSISCHVTHLKKCVVARNGHIMTRKCSMIDVGWKCMYISCHITHLQYVYFGENWLIYDKKLNYNWCLAEMYIHFLSPTIGV